MSRSPHACPERRALHLPPLAVTRRKLPHLAGGLFLQTVTVAAVALPPHGSAPLLRYAAADQV